MEERPPKPIPAKQRDIRFMLNKCKPCKESGWWILQRYAVVLLLFPLWSLERPTAPQMCHDWVWMHRCALQLSVTQGRNRYASTSVIISGTNCSIHLPCFYPFFCASPFFLAGGCSISPRASFTPFVGFYLDCAAYPTSQFSPASAGSKSAAQTMVRTMQQRAESAALQPLRGPDAIIGDDLLRFLMFYLKLDLDIGWNWVAHVEVTHQTSTMLKQKLLLACTAVHRTRVMHTSSF